MRGRPLGLALLLAALALPRPGAAAPAGNVDALLVRLDRSSQSVKSLSGEFEQKSRVKLFKQELTSTGRFYFARPRRIRWQYLAPDPSTMIVDGDKAVLAMPGAPLQTFDLARDATMRAIFDQLSSWLGASSLSTLKEGYELAAAGTDDAPILLLTPRPGGVVAKAFAKIELRFDKQLLLRAILLKEASGDEKEIRFTKLVRDAKLPDDAFKP